MSGLRNCVCCVFFAEMDIAEWNGEDEEDRYGYCHRYPPVYSPVLYDKEAYGNTHSWGFPFIERAQSWWCGEFKKGWG